ncbi:unnamed protein product [Mytilus coruscus]|uniref:Reverse transcriptase domain-containing protein n=1 Tax=Mytilus coruscus TaxID=42192 RepID=A0A6J8BYT1_MYTCO|nr:unnamed protein product [Mytilus coruscus]
MAGDINASIMKENMNRRDKLFLAFMHEFELHIQTPIFTIAGNTCLELTAYYKKDETIKKVQSPLQRSFTSVISGLYAALILNELIAEVQDLHIPLYVAFLDAQKAFDLVWHSSLLRKFHQSGIESDSWLMFKEWYKELTSRIKWESELSKILSEHQELRHDGVTSPAAYKLFINHMLDHIETQDLGSYIGPIYYGTPTVADDVCLVSNNPEYLQVTCQ